jgi:hydroxypyruvate isomerase
MKRRDFLKAGFAAAGGTLATGSVVAHESPFENLPASFRLNYAPHFGMFKHLAGNNLLDQIQCAAELGFRAWEDRGMRTRPLALQRAISRKMQSVEMQMGAFEAAMALRDLAADGSAAAAEQRVLQDVREWVEVAKRVHGRWITVETEWARIGRCRVQRNRCLEVLKRCSEILEPHNLVLVLKPSGGEGVRAAEQVYRWCKAVDSPACKFLFNVCQHGDVQQDLISCIDRFWPELAYVHCRRNPDPHLPETRAEDGRHMFAHLHARGYTGIVGMEHGNSQPGRAGDWAVLRSYVRADQF